MLRKLNRLWKIVKEVNLEAIRRRAETPLRLLVVGEEPADREAVARLLTGDGGANPFLRVVSDDEVASRDPAELAVLVSRTRGLSGPLESARAALRSRNMPLVAVEPDAGPDTIADALFDAVAGDTRLALARQFPGLRQPLFDQLIEETSRANASYSFSTGLAEVVPLLDVPLNVGDIVVLTKNQLVMAYRIALAAGKEGRPSDVIGEIAGVLGGGLLFRQIARELIGLVPVLGIVPKVVVAYAGTWAIGHAVVAWATGAEQATKRSVKELYAKGLDRGRAVAGRIASATT